MVRQRQLACSESYEHRPSSHHVNVQKLMRLSEHLGDVHSMILRERLQRICYLWSTKACLGVCTRALRIIFNTDRQVVWKYVICEHKDNANSGPLASNNRHNQSTCILLLGTHTQFQRNTLTSRERHPAPHEHLASSTYHQAGKLHRVYRG